MAKVAGSQLPLEIARRSFHGRVVFSTFRGVPVVKGWPRKRGPGGTPAQLQARADFKRMCAAVADMSAEDRVGAMELAHGTAYTWRDVLSTYVTGAPFTFEGMDMITTQAALDLISSIPGSILIRGADAWIGLEPGSPDDVLTRVLAEPFVQWQGNPALEESGVEPGSYSNTDLTVDARGRITAAANGAGPGGGGAVNLISTKTGASVTTVEWTGLNPEHSWQMIGRFMVPATNTVDPAIQFGTGSGPTWITTGYHYNHFISGSDGSAGFVQANGAEGRLAIAVSNSKPGCSFDIRIHTDGSRVAWHGTGEYQKTSGNDDVFMCGGRLNLSAPITAMRLRFHSGNISDMEGSLYSIAA